MTDSRLSFRLNEIFNTGFDFLKNQSEKDRQESIHNIRCNQFEEVMQYFYKNNVSLSEMIEIIGSKALRHSNYDEHTLGFRIAETLAAHTKHMMD